MMEKWGDVGGEEEPGAERVGGGGGCRFGGPLKPFHCDFVL